MRVNKEKRGFVEGEEKIAEEGEEEKRGMRKGEKGRDKETKKLEPIF